MVEREPAKKAAAKKVAPSSRARKAAPRKAARKAPAKKLPPKAAAAKATEAVEEVLNQPAEKPARQTAAERREAMANRNFRVFALFVAGNSERDIGRIVGLSGQRVHQIIKDEIKNGDRHRKVMTDQALALYQTRLETLWKVLYPQVIKGDLKAVEGARRVLQQQAQLYNIEEERVGMIPPLSDQELLADPERDDTPPEVDELSAWRNRHQPVSPPPHADAPEAEVPDA